MSLYLPASFDKRKEALVRLADLTAHNSELREHFSGPNLFHKYNIFFCLQNTHKHIAVSLHIFLWFFWHIFMNCLQVCSLQHLMLGIWVVGLWELVTYFICYYFCSSLAEMVLHWVWFNILWCQWESLWLQCTWVQPFVREGTGRSHWAFSLWSWARSYLGTQQTLIPPHTGLPQLHS